MVDFVTRMVGWKVEGRYNALSYEVNENWGTASSTTDAGQQLRQSVANDPGMRVLIVHG